MRLIYSSSFLDISDALHNGSLQPLGLLVVKVHDVQEGGGVCEPYLQFGMPLRVREKLLASCDIFYSWF